MFDMLDILCLRISVCVSAFEFVYMPCYNPHGFGLVSPTLTIKHLWQTA